MKLPPHSDLLTGSRCLEDKIITVSKDSKKDSFIINCPNVLQVTWNSGGYSTSEGTDCCHGNLLRGVLLGAGVSGRDHVRFEQSTLQIHMVVR